MNTTHSRLRRIASLALATMTVFALAAPALAAPSAAQAYPDGPQPSQFPVKVLGAAGRIHFAVSPLDIRTSFATKSAYLRVDNQGRYETNFTVSVSDFTVDDNGNQTLVPAGQGDGTASWYHFTQPTFTLAPGTGTTVPFTVEAPADARPGDHFVAVRITGQASEAAVASLVGKNSTMLLKTPAAVQVTVVHRVPGDLVSKITAALNIPSMLVVTNPNGIDLEARLADAGNTVLYLSGGTSADHYATRQTPTLDLVGKIPMLNGNASLFTAAPDGTPSDIHLLPGTHKTEKVHWASVPIFGAYDYTYTIPGSADDNRAPITIHGSFMVINVVMLIIVIAIVLLVILILVGTTIIRRRGDRSRKQKFAAGALRESRALKEQARKALEAKEAKEKARTGSEGPSSAEPKASDEPKVD